MKAFVVNQIQKHSEIRDVQVPKTGKGEVLIEISAAPINPSDLRQIETIQAENTDQIFIPGIEGCGRVIAAGKGLLPALWKGKRVACLSTYTYSGTWAQFMVTKAARCFPVPDYISDEQASMMFVNPLTAISFFEIIKKEGHHSVINQAAGSALGKLIILLAKKNRIPLINIVRSNEIALKLTRSGAENILINTLPDFNEKLEKLIENLHPTLLLDPVGGRLCGEILEKMPMFSKAILYGRLSGENLDTNPGILISGNRTISGFYLRNQMQHQNMLKTISMLLKARKLLSGVEKIKVREKTVLDDIPEAILRYKNKMSDGKIIICPNGVKQDLNFISNLSG